MIAIPPPRRVWRRTLRRIVPTGALAAVLALATGSLALTAGCTTGSDRPPDTRTSAATDPAVDNKLDAPLRQALRQAANSDTSYQVLIELEGELDDQMRSALEAADLRDVTAPGRIATASGSPEAIRRAAALDFVRSVSLSQERPPLD